MLLPVYCIQKDFSEDLSFSAAGYYVFGVVLLHLVGFAVNANIFFCRYKNFVFNLYKIYDLLMIECNFDLYLSDIQSFKFEDQNLIPAFSQNKFLEVLINLKNALLFS